MELGKIGIWVPHMVGPDAAPLVEELGYGAIWLGASPAVDQARPWLEATSTIKVATGILNVWQHEPADVAAAAAALRADHPGRFLLGIGIGHPEATSDYKRPLTAMRTFLDGLDAAREDLVLAALGPKMLDLAGERSLGTHPYFTTPDHTRFARERLGPDALVAPELALVVEADHEVGRAKARKYAALYLGLRNYTNNLKDFGFTDADIADGGSDRLIDAVVPHGTPEALAAVVQAHLDAGADHVCVQPLGHGPHPRDDYRALAAVLLR